MKKYLTAFSLVLFSIVLWFLNGYSEQSLILKRISAPLQDVLFKVRYVSESRPESLNQIVVIAVDDESSFRLGVRWPWPRTIFASIIDELARKKAKVIGLNFSFTGLEGGKEDTTLALADSIRNHGHVVVGSTLDKDRPLRPVSLLLRAGAHYGYLEKIVDEDFLIRRSYLSRSYIQRAVEEPSFPLSIWKEAGQDPAALSDWKRKDGSYVINYLANDSDLKVIPAWKLLEGHISESQISGKIALVGITSSLMSEKHQTPLGLMSGVAVHANEYISFGESRRLHLAPRSITFGVSWILGMMLLVLLRARRFWLAGLGFLGCYFLIFLGAQFLFARDISLPLFLWLMGPTLALAIGTFANFMHLLFENKGLENRVIHDKMTGLYTYDYLRLRLDDEWKRCQKTMVPVSVVMTDLDRFKKINDTLGHEVGNQMILRASAVIKESVRGYDVVSRYGGDEFVILLWHANAQEAEAYRLRLRKMYEDMAKKLDEVRLQDSSISIGFASFDPKSDGENSQTPQQLIELADKNLFEDKESRRKPGEPKR